MNQEKVKKTRRSFLSYRHLVKPGGRYHVGCIEVPSLIFNTQMKVDLLKQWTFQKKRLW